MEHSPQLEALAAALSAAQAVMTPAKKDSDNPFYKSKYADLASVWDAAQKPLTSNGLSVVQLPGFEDGRVTLTTVLLHQSGQWIAEKAGSPIAKADAQGVGSAISYLRRYALAAVSGVVTEDDDGHAASKAGSHSDQPRNPGSTEDGEIKLPGKPEQWDGHGGKPLGDVPLDVLVKARAWLHKKDAKKNHLLITAIDEESERRRDAA